MERNYETEARKIVAEHLKNTNCSDWFKRKAEHNLDAIKEYGPEYFKQFVKKMERKEDIDDSLYCCWYAAVDS